MIGWLRSALRRPSARARAVVLTALLVGAVVLTPALTHGIGQHSHRPSVRAKTTGTARRARQGRSSVPAAQIARARRAAHAFLEGYLRFAYGRASGASVPAAAPALRRQLSHDHVLVTPVQRRRRPRVVSLTATGEATGVVFATGLIDDGGIAAYSLRITLQKQRTGWLVSGVDGG